MLEALRDISVKVELPAAALVVNDKPVVPAPAIVEEPSRDNPTPAPSSPAISSSADSYSRRFEGSENGAETEEDEGMVLVGRPHMS
jgi:lysophosphatidate acyltransferase